MQRNGSQAKYWVGVAVEHSGGQWDRVSKELEKTNHKFHRSSFFGMHRMSLSLLGSPLNFTLSHSSIEQR